MLLGQTVSVQVDYFLIDKIIYRYLTFQEM